MNANLLTTPQPTSSIATFRRLLLRIHGTILTLVALGGAVATTIGWMTGTGLFGFMQQNPMVWVGLIQAYLLMTIIAVLLVLGSGQANSRKWNVVGALAHCAPLIAALFVRCIRVNGSTRNCQSEYWVPHCLALS